MQSNFKKFFKNNHMFNLIFMIAVLLMILLGSINILAADLTIPDVDYQSFELGNGLQIMVFPDHSIPSLKLAVYYKVGAIDEQQGQTGISHFLEHSMFLGTESVPEGKIDDLISHVGGQLNAATNFDYTYYYYQVPSSMLELVMALEADRMRNLKFDPAEIERERKVVMQERRLRTENNIFSNGFEKIKAYALKDSYLEHNVVGWMKDISKITVPQLKSYYQSYYAPNNAILVVSGDVNYKQVKRLAKKYYGDYQPQKISRPQFNLPVQKQEKVIKLHLPTKIPYALMLYQIPAGDSKDLPAINIFLDILANNQSSRLKEKLQQQDKLILESGAFLYQLREPSFALVYFIPSSENLVDQAQLAFDQELNNVLENGITEAEFELVKKQYQKSLIFSQRDIDSIAASKALAKLRYNKPDLENEKIAIINQLTKEDVIRIAKHYFQPEQRTRGYILPAKEGEQK
ncbi:M16 family metallopeptidase [Halanaerobium salsuginis]|uniref:Zinc protease n=1 Tax=Halanaerobium salsuginis TaxID=29563 RepID=A0A1I4HMK9_9FIRM|nr:pitrilysin family protein [Halanaerobium salsuginis]SFL43415.1 zinc protease [Halanaerobium salsuginis]